MSRFVLLGFTCLFFWGGVQITHGLQSDDACQDSDMRAQDGNSFLQAYTHHQLSKKSTWENYTETAGRCDGKALCTFVEESGPCSKQVAFGSHLSECMKMCDRVEACSGFSWTRVINIAGDDHIHCYLMRDISSIDVSGLSHLSSIRGIKYKLGCFEKLWLTIGIGDCRTRAGLLPPRFYKGGFGAEVECKAACLTSKWCQAVSYIGKGSSNGACHAYVKVSQVYDDVKAKAEEQGWISQYESATCGTDGKECEPVSKSNGDGNYTCYKLHK